MVLPVSRHVSFLREREGNFAENSKGDRGNLFSIKSFYKKRERERRVIKIIENVLLFSIS